MEFYQVLEKRRTVRDFSDRKVDDEVLKRILGAAFKAPTNDHLRQFEFVVVRGQERIGRIISPVSENTRNIQQTGGEVAGDTRDRDEYAMFVAQATADAYAERLPCFAVFPSERLSAVPPCRSKFAQLFRFSVGGCGKYSAGSDGGRTGLRVSYTDR